MKKIPFVRTIIFSLTPLFVIIFISELVSNIYYYTNHGILGFPLNIFIGKKEQPYVVYKLPIDPKSGKLRPGTYTTQQNIQYTVNSSGFRGREIEVNRSDKIRIICLGGSTTIGLEVSDGETYPALLEKQLKNNGIEAEVINAGFSSWSLETMRELYQNEIQNLNPDIVVLYNNRNSAFYDSQRDFDSTNRMISNKEISFIHDIVDWAKRNVMSIRAGSAVYRRLSARFHNSKNDFGYMYANHGSGKILFEKKYFVNGYSDYLSDFASEILKDGADVIIMTQPIYTNTKGVVSTLYNLSQKDLYAHLWSPTLLSETLRNNDIEMPDDVSSFYLVTNAILNNHMRNIGDELDIYIADAAPRFQNKNQDVKYLFTDYLHMSESGNHVLADSLYEQIICINKGIEAHNC